MRPPSSGFRSRLRHASKSDPAFPPGPQRCEIRACVTADVSQVGILRHHLSLDGEYITSPQRDHRLLRSSLAKQNTAGDLFFSKIFQVPKPSVLH
jgi:hypothetical protein